MKSIQAHRLEGIINTDAINIKIPHYELNIDNKSWELFREGNIIELYMSTYSGAFNAEHYYGKIIVPSAKIISHSNGTYCSVGGALGGYEVPKEYTGLEIELDWKITRKEAKYLNEKTNIFGVSGCFKAGDYTGGFYNRDGVLKRAKEIIDKHFNKDVIIDYSGLHTKGLLLKYFNKNRLTQLSLQYNED